MTLDEKIGQMTQPEQDKVLGNAGEHAEVFYRLCVKRRGFRPGQRYRPYRNGQSLWRVQGRGRKNQLKIPALLWYRCVHGHSNWLGAVMFPHNIALGCTRDPELWKKLVILLQGDRATGVHWTFAPAVTVPRTSGGAAHMKAIQEDPEIVKTLGKQYHGAVKALTSLIHISVSACAKSFCRWRWNRGNQDAQARVPWRWYPPHVAWPGGYKAWWGHPAPYSTFRGI